MNATELASFRAKLDSLLTEADRKESEREAKRGRVNVYRLGHYLNAAENLMHDITTGNVPLATAFAGNFNPTREMHGIARKLGLPLDVERGRWVHLAATTHGEYR